ncbi:MAG: twin-arginine translocation signal domain-containing protein, partial [Acidobacteriaceae bacterium]|nr:twin-arginine translocation signal domain-containing protein [Acidobacteriaceae bacterium]
MSRLRNSREDAASRRSFLKTGLAAGSAAVGAGILASGSSLFAEDLDDEGDDGGGQLTRGDASILRFLA